MCFLGQSFEANVILVSFILLGLVFSFIGYVDGGFI